jgi:DNA-binding FadR family transcriptional regulator
VKVRRRFGAGDVIADRLRERLLSGAMADGAMLPKQEDLAAEFGVSKAAIREACRILEAEGLLHTIRGNVGGAVVNVPTPETAAYTIGMVLQARGVTTADVWGALQRLEPMVVELCSERADREEVLLPELERAQAALARAISDEDGDAASLAARRWHETLVEHCGNESIVVLLGTLEAVWSSHARDAASRADAVGLEPDLASMKHVFDDHERIQRLIRSGETRRAVAATRKHLQTARIYPERDERRDVAISSTVIRDLRV